MADCFLLMTNMRNITYDYTSCFISEKFLDRAPLLYIKTGNIQNGVDLSLGPNYVGKQ